MLNTIVKAGAVGAGAVGAGAVGAGAVGAGAVGAGAVRAASCYGSGSDQMMRLLAALAPQHW
jgi:hypothetical protein